MPTTIRPEFHYETAQKNKRLYEAMQQLTEIQRRRLQMYADGLSYREIARREGVSDHKKIIKSVEACEKENSKFFLRRGPKRGFFSP